MARTLFGVPTGALGYCSDRLIKSDVTLTRSTNLAAQERLEFTEPDGTRLSVVEDDLRELSAEPPTSDLPGERALTGIASVGMVVSSIGETARFLT
ncbi:MAG TPA: hypothetical protein VGB55_07695 [Tepidisphaeraceae bacterium]